MILLSSKKPCLVGKVFSTECCICHHFEEHQTIHLHHTLHAMPLAQAVTTVVAQPHANACRLHCVEHFYSTTKSLTNVMAYMLHIALFKDLCQYLILNQIGLFAPLSFDSQLSCVFYFKCIPTFSNVFPWHHAAARTSNMSLHTSGHVCSPKSKHYIYLHT